MGTVERGKRHLLLMFGWVQKKKSIEGEEGDVLSGNGPEN